MTPERIAALEAAAAQEDASASAVLDSMLDGDGPVDGVNPVAPAGVALDEAVSPVAGRRFSRN